MSQAPFQCKVRGVVIDGGKVLMCELARKDAQFWCLPGGTLEEGETLRDGLVREMIEELGVKPDVGPLLSAQEFFSSDGRHVLDFWFLVRNAADYRNLDLSKASHGFEHSAVEFLDLEAFAGDFRPKQLKGWMNDWSRNGLKFVAGPGLE
jgi:ADP-ribose pyrophosphatase YjhB (NUDIX family)